MSDWGLAALPLLGVAFGAALQFWFGRTADRKKQAEGLRARAYADYLRSVAAAAHSHSDDDLHEARRDVADAKARIAVYGAVEVIGALARFEEAGANLSSESGQSAFVQVVSAMRATGSKVPQRDLKLLLLGAA